ncbi:MAG: regulatory protein MarR [Acidimicrobiales bacterium]|nr:regulatory protein MarR [Acidimicrobiales bacterium]
MTKSTRQVKTTFPQSSAWDRPGFVLWHATLYWQRAVAEVLRPLALTHAQFVLLAGTVWLEARGDGPPSQRELADHSGTDAMMTSQVVRALEARGLLQREGDAADARVRRLRATPAGRRLAGKAVEVVEAMDAELFDSVDREQLLHSLRRLAGRDDTGERL